MDVSTPPKLRLRLSPSESELSKQDHMFMEWSVDKTKYGQEASHLPIHKSL